jgi:hypothetical protein
MIAGKRSEGSDDGRVWDGRRVAARRRKHRLAPGVIGLCLVMVLASSLVAASPNARAAPVPEMLAQLFASHSGGNPSNVTNESVCEFATIKFTETGLPSGDKWAVTLSGDKVSSSAATITFTEQCSVVYPYTVTPPAGYYASPQSGNVSGTITIYVTISTCNPVYKEVEILDVQLTNGSTSASLSWDESPAGSSTTLNWGTTTSYPFSQGVAGSGTYSVLLNYLEPTTKYYFEIVASPPSSTCQYIYTTGTQTGSVTTISDSVTAISGTVYDSNGKVDTAGNLYVNVGCVSGASSVGWDLTSSSGQYSVTVYNSITGYACSSAGYSVQVDNWPVDWAQELNEYSNQWTGAHWNETIEIYAPQTVNFYLPVKILGPLTPMVLDFTNTAAVWYDYESTLYTTTNSSWQFNGQGESATVTSGNLLGLNTAKNPGSNLEYYAAYDVVGTVNFNAVGGRTAQVSSWSYVGPPLTTDNSPNQATDPVTPFFTGYGTTETCHIVAPGGAEQDWGTTYAQSYELTSSFNLDFGLSVDLGAGLSVSTTAISYSNSISNGGGQSWTLTVWAYLASGATTYVWTYVQPGTTNQVGPIVHSWSGPSCPT